MTPLFIPSVGAKVLVPVTWKFPLYWERRNDPLFGYLGIERPEKRTFFDDYVGGRAAFYGVSNEPRKLKSSPATLEAGTVLTIDRIYLRKGKEDFDSISFIVKDARVPGKVGAQARVRFWAKLEDVNAAGLVLLEDQ